MILRTIQRNTSTIGMQCMLVCVLCSSSVAETFQQSARPLLTKYCSECHSGDDANGDVDFSAITTKEHIDQAFELWESVANHLRSGTMPPEDQPRPSTEESKQFLNWYQEFTSQIEARPAVLRPRRLSVTEYRNTLRSLLGFDLEVDVIEAEQTVTERSMVVKLLPVDPPGKSGFKNDTHGNPLSSVVWDQYSYVIDAALEELFTDRRRKELESLAGKFGDDFSTENALRSVRTVLQRSRRRSVDEQDLAPFISKISDLQSKPESERIEVAKRELKTILMSPAFIYRGLLVKGKRGERQPVDPFEFAERLSYFLWADMPDDHLIQLAEDGSILNDRVIESELDRMLGSPKAKSLAEVFALEWLTLSEIEHVSNNPPVMVALKSQPIDFMHYLFTENRPILELIDSRTAFINPHTARMYGPDAKQMPRYVKQKGIEVEIVANHKIELRSSDYRGGILTMPGVLAMNRGPILRGTWILERILGEHLPDPPANVGQVEPNPPGKKLTFRQRFEQHRANAACAVCHDKIDPLGFALGDYDNGGKYLRKANYQPSKKQRKKQKESIDVKRIDTSGKLPTGEKFKNINELKYILQTSQREVVIRNVVERTMSYALCRRLQVFDRPTVNAITTQMVETNGTWRDLFVAIVKSVPFREMLLSASE